MKIQFIFAFCVSVLFACNANENLDLTDKTTDIEAQTIEGTNPYKQIIINEVKGKAIEESEIIESTPPVVVEKLEPIVKDSNVEPVEEVVEIAPPAPNFHEYTEWNSLLKKYVSASGKVNYAGFKSDKAKLNAVCEDLKKNAPASDWTKNQKLAYWINVYNAFTIKLVVDNYPTSSITKIMAKPWDKKFISIGGVNYSLNDVENNIIRKRFNEPRIHFALNCASESCPILLNVAYTASNLNYRLTAQTKKFFQDAQKNNFSDPKAITISKIFDWYKVDFNKNGKTVVDFINQYRTEQLSNPSISYMEYSWDLNK